MTNCKWEQDEVCVNAACPLCADFCPLTDTPGVCRFEERGTETKDPICTKTNADKIRAMTDEELANLLAHYDDWTDEADLHEVEIYKRWLDWLKQEVSV